MTTLAEALEAAQTGFARLAWRLVEGEGRRAARRVGVGPALQRPDGSIPDSDDEPDLVAVVGKAY